MPSLTKQWECTATSISNFITIMIIIFIFIIHYYEYLLVILVIEPGARSRRFIITLKIYFSNKIFVIIITMKYATDENIYNLRLNKYRYF